MPLSKETLHYRKNNNLCPRCGSKNVEGKSLCQKHLDKFAQKASKYRKNKINKGLCPECGKENSSKYYCCNSCKERNKTKDRKNYEKRYQDRKENGICFDCGLKKEDTTKTRCNKCLKISAEKQNNIVKKRIEDNLCVVCGKNKTENKRMCNICSEKRSKWYKKSETREKDTQKREKRKSKIFHHYGNKCSCCGEDNPCFLAIDHINNDGHIHRKEINKAGSTFYKWLIDNNFPPEFQILCHNCNMGKYYNGGTCPCQQKQIDR